MDATGKYLSTAEVGEALGITPAAVRRLVREGLLEVKERKLYKTGEDYYFDQAEVQDLLPQMPGFKRKWQSEEDSRLGARKAAFMRLAAVKKTLRHGDIKNNFLLSLESYPEKTAALLRASYFLYHLNHYAKGGEEYLYDLKEKVIRKFLLDYTPENGLEVSFIKGGPRVYLCAACRSKAKNMGLDYSKYKSIYDGCPQCRKENDYYSLFEFKVEYGEHRFCFHTPYHIARKWFEEGRGLPGKTSERGKEEAFPFGRPISEAEARAVTLDEVTRELTSFLGG